MNLVKLGVNAVDAANALNEPRRIPRKVIIDDDVGAMQVDAFSENFRCNQNAEIITRSIRLRVKVGSDIFADTVKRLAGKEQGFRFDFFDSDLVLELTAGSNRQVNHIPDAAGRGFRLEFFDKDDFVRKVHVVDH